MHRCVCVSVCRMCVHEFIHVFLSECMCALVHDDMQSRLQILSYMQLMRHSLSPI